MILGWTLKYFAGAATGEPIAWKAAMLASAVYIVAGGVQNGIAIGDMLFVIFAEGAIFPTIFAFGVDSVMGPELAFITLPQVFLQMPGGRIVGSVFYFLLQSASAH